MDRSGARAPGGPATVPGPDATSRPGVARERQNLLEQLTASSVVSDYAAAEDPRPSSRRQRRLVAAAGVAVAGFVIAVGLSARILNAPVVSEQRAALRERIDQQDQRRAELTEQLTGLRQQVQAARTADLEATNAGRLLNARIVAYELVTGYTAVTGPGATVTLTDAATPDEDDPALSKVLDADVQAAVNGLWTAGAEAVAVNRQRLTARSAIRSAAGAILVDYRPLTPPYVVEAIGPTDLDRRFAQTQGAAELREVSRRFGIGFENKAADRLELPAATSALPDQASVAEGAQDGGSS